MQPPVTAAALAPGSIVAVAGASARAAAGSLRRAGLVPICADMFCDRDLITLSKRAAACPPGRFPETLPEVLESLDVPIGTPLLLTGAMENHLAVVRRLGEKYSLLTSIDAIEAVRDPLISQMMPAIPGIAWPETRPGPITAMRTRPGSEWLIKPRRSAGGRGIRVATRGIPIDERQIVQRRIDGVSLGTIYIVPLGGPQRGQAVPVGSTLQILGDGELGTSGFQYSGSAGPLPTHDTKMQTLRQLGDKLMRRFKLTGVFGVDTVFGTAGQFHPVDVNPRYPASVEVVESALGISIISMLRGDPPPVNRRFKTLCGKAIVHAKANCRAGELYALFSRDEVADVPEVGSEVLSGHPICTVFARASSHEECVDKLRAMARDVYTRGVS